MRRKRGARVERRQGRHVEAMERYGNQWCQASPGKVRQPCCTIHTRAASAAGSAPEVPAAPEKKAIGYGLPCSRCHAYYPADMHVCPICKSPDRVSPTAPGSAAVASAAPQPAAGAAIDSERERLLKELKSQAFASHTQINAAATFRCVLEHQHSGATEPAAVCHTCYGEVRQQADRMEAALHMDAKEAAKIVYEAVWADTSDPNTHLPERRHRPAVGVAQTRRHRPPARRKSAPGALASSH